MKTIEERAYSRYADNNCPRDCEKCEMRTDCTDVDYVWAFIDGAQSEHEELTRWHDAKNDPPIHDAEVLCMVHRQFNTYEVCRYNKSGWWVKAPLPQSGWCGADCEIIAWRDIHDRPSN